MSTMKRFLMAGVAMVFLSTGPLALAQQMDHDQHDQGQHAPAQHDQHAQTQHVATQHAQGQHEMAPAHDDHMAPPTHYSDNQMQNRGGDHQWHEGDHYNGGRQAVDWRHHHLRQPPSGYEWVQNGNDYVLIAIGSGIIASIIANAMNQ
jgi:Ni/Co efflux regulator RcnB